MSDDTNETSSTEGSIDAELAQVTSTYKILGLLDDGGGVGVLGQNDASSGTPVGIQGAVPNAPNSGYGLQTPHDAKVDGVAELNALAGSVTGGTEVSDLTGNKISIDNSGSLNWAGTYRTNSFSASGTTWTPISGLSGETPVEVRIDTTNQTSGRIRLDVDGSLEQYGGTGDVVTRVVGPSSSVSLTGEDYFEQETDVDISNNTDRAAGLAFKSDDGSKFYVCDRNNDDVNSYTLGTNWDVDTASYNDTLDVSGTAPNPRSVKFKDDGTRMFVASENNGDIVSYLLNNAWQVGGVSNTSTLDISAEESVPRGLTFRDDGSKLYVTGLGSRKLKSYSLSTNWDIDTASYTGNELDLRGFFDSSSRPSGIGFTENGSRMFVSFLVPGEIFEFRLSNAWDITSATRIDVFDQLNGSYGIAFKADESKLYYPTSVSVVQLDKSFNGSVYAAVASE